MFRFTNVTCQRQILPTVSCAPSSTPTFSLEIPDMDTNSHKLCKKGHRLLPLTGMLKECIALRTRQVPNRGHGGDLWPQRFPVRMKGDRQQDIRRRLQPSMDVNDDRYLIGKKLTHEAQWTQPLTKWSRLKSPEISHVNTMSPWSTAMRRTPHLVVFFAKIQNSSVVLRKHRTNPKWGTFYKMQNQNSLNISRSWTARKD